MVGSDHAPRASHPSRDRQISGKRTFPVLSAQRAEIPWQNAFEVHGYDPILPEGVTGDAEYEETAMTYLRGCCR